MLNAGRLIVNIKKQRKIETNEQGVKRRNIRADHKRKKRQNDKPGQNLKIYHSWPFFFLYTLSHFIS